MSLIYNATFDSQTRVLSLLDKAGNVISSCEVPSKGNVDDITKPLTFRATQDGSTVKLSKVGSPFGDFQTSRDGGKPWVDYTLGTTITLNSGEEVSFRTRANRLSNQISTNNYFNFKMTGKIEAWHNVMSMCRKDDFATYKSVVGYAFYRLFRECTSLIKSPALPATTLAPFCYASLFSGCTSLAVAPPALPATTLAKGCYQHMFWGCKPLTKSPALSATALAEKCYYQMFYGCSSLHEVHCKMPSSYSSSQISSYANDWLSGVSSTGTFYTNVDANWSSGTSGIPTGWTRVNEGAPSVDDPSKPLMLRSLENASTVTLQKNGTLSNTYQTSTDGTNWTDYTLGTQISLNNEDVIYFRCSNHPTTQSDSNYVNFVMTGKIEAWHNAYSMISSSFTNTGKYVPDFGMYKLFAKCESLTKAPLLVNAPSRYSYFSMFDGCKALTRAPELPSKSVSYNCYQYMFWGCQALTQAPELPAMTLADECYSNMFGNCKSLTKAPALPATTLAKRCYEHMFYNCPALTQAPALPATILAQSCYRNMFSGCSKLNEVRIAATTTASYALENWLKDVSATGNFYCDPDATIFPTDSASGIPSGWTRRDINIIINIINALTLTATADNSSVKLTKNGTLDNTFEVDTGNGWTAYEFNTVIPLNAGQSCKWRCKSHPTTQTVSNCVQFVMTGTIEASGNVNSMLSSDFENITSLTGYDYAFTILFRGCGSLKRAPELPATALSPYCYNSMFNYCSGLIRAPKLPATEIADHCYDSMFKDCNALEEAPEQLPATILAENCYSYMFSYCRSLIKAPEQLPATTLTKYCYYQMFSVCNSLTKAPLLPATALTEHCYSSMFSSCTSLGEVRIAATDISAPNCISSWMQNVPDTGDFYCNPTTTFPTGSDGCPSGWTKHALADYPNP